MLSVGRLEKEHAEALKDIYEIFSSPKALQDFVESTKPETLGGIVKVLFELNNITSKEQNMNDLKPEEKEKLGHMLKQLSSDLQALKLEYGAN